MESAKVNAKIMPDKRQAMEFVEALTGSKNTKLHIQALDDKKVQHPRKCIYDTVDRAWAKIEQYQKDGFGIFITINKTDGRGRARKNITGVRAVFIDTDNNAVIPDLPFHIQTGRDEKHNHFYWKVRGLKIDQFSEVQKKLIKKYRSDPSIKDLSRVMRLPGTYNLKKKPVLHRLIKVDPNVPLYTKFGKISDSPSPVSAASPPSDILPGFSTRRYIERLKEYGAITENRNEKLYELAAMGHALGVDEPERLKILTYFNNAKIDPPLSVGELRKVNHNATLYAQKGIGEESEYSDFGDPFSSGKSVDDGTNKNPVSEWAYILQTNSFHIISRQPRTEERDGLSAVQFDSWFASSFPEIKGKVSNHVLKKDKIKKVARLEYNPQKPTGINADTFNTYFPSPLRPQKGDMDWFFNHTAYMIPDTDERKAFMDFYFHQILHPGEKMKYALLMQSVEGVGKGLLAEILSLCIGESNVSAPESQIMSNFNNWALSSSLIIIDEILMTGRTDLMNKLKGWITERNITINIKNRSAFVVENVFNIMAFTNHVNAINITKHDRRWLVIRVKAAPREKAYYKRLFSNKEKYAARLLWYAQNEFQFSTDYAPQGTAPRTKGRSDVIEAGRQDYENDFDEVIADLKSDIVSLKDVLDRMPEKTRTTRNLLHKLVNHLHENDGEKLGQFMIGGGRPALWAVRDKEKYENMSAEDIRAYYKRRVLDKNDFE